MTKQHQILTAQTRNKALQALNTNKDGSHHHQNTHDYNFHVPMQQKIAIDEQNSYNPTPMSQAKSCPMGQRSTRHISSGLNNYAEQDQSPLLTSKNHPIYVREGQDTDSKEGDNNNQGFGEEISVSQCGGVMIDNEREKVDQANQDELSRLKTNNSKLFKIEETSNTNRQVPQQNRLVQLIDNRQDRSERKFQDEFHQWVAGPHLETHRQQLHNQQFGLMTNLSGEQTLKLNVPGSNRIQTRNSNQIGSNLSGNNLTNSFQKQCQDLYEEKKHLLSQLREFGQFRESGSNQQMDLLLMKDFKFDSKTVQTTINKSSQGDLTDTLIAISKHQRKSKQKQLSVGESKLFPKTCPGMLPGQSISLQSSLPDALYENPIISTNRFDDRHNSILCPPFLEQQDYKDRQILIQQSQKNQLNNFCQSLDRHERKVNQIQNKIASMNGQIILNLNQSIFKNMHNQIIQKQLLQQPLNLHKMAHDFKSPRKQPPTTTIHSLPLDGMHKLNNMFLTDSKGASILPTAADHFDSTRSMHQSPSSIPGVHRQLGPVQQSSSNGLTHIPSLGIPNSSAQMTMPSIFKEQYHQGREIRIQLTDVKKRREDSMDQNNQMQFELHTGQPNCPENSFSPLRRELKNSSISPIKNIFVETGQSLSRGTNPRSAKKKKQESASQPGGFQNQTATSTTPTLIQDSLRKK